MSRYQFSIVLLLGALLTVFAIENMATIQVSFFGQAFETRRFILILASVVVGFALGKSFNVRRKK